MYKYDIYHIYIYTFPQQGQGQILKLKLFWTSLVINKRIGSIYFSWKNFKCCWWFKKLFWGIEMRQKNFKY